jgi:hypothetical protein
LTANQGGTADERILAVWPENDINWGFGFRTSRRLVAARLFFTDSRLLMVKLVSILSPGFAGTMMAVRAAELERKEQNERMRHASPGSLLASDPENVQISYQQISELTYDKKYLRIKFDSSTARVHPVKSGGFLAYAHPDAVDDPKRLMDQTIEILKSVPEISSKIVVRP